MGKTHVSASFRNSSQQSDNPSTATHPICGGIITSIIGEIYLNDTFPCQDITEVEKCIRIGTKLLKKNCNKVKDIQSYRII